MEVHADINENCVILDLGYGQINLNCEDAIALGALLQSYGNYVLVNIREEHINE